MPHLQSMSEAPDEDYEREGFAWFDEHVEERHLALPKLKKELGVTTNGYTMADFWRMWRQSKDSLYVVRFSVERVY